MNKQTPDDCRHFEALLSEWVFEESLNEKQLAPLKGHLKTCQECKNLKSDYEKLKQPLEAEEPLKAPAELKQRILNELNQTTRQSRAPIIYGLVKTACAAGILLMIALGVHRYSQNQPITISFLKPQFLKPETPQNKQKIKNIETTTVDEDTLLLFKKDDSIDQRAPLTPLAESETGRDEENLTQKEIPTKSEQRIIRLNADNYQSFITWCEKNNLAFEELETTKDHNLHEALTWNDQLSHQDLLQKQLEISENETNLGIAQAQDLGGGGGRMAPTKDSVGTKEKTFRGKRAAAKAKWLYFKITFEIVDLKTQSSDK